ncbi:serine/threonine protein kinase Ran1 [Chytriomyces hyalinus]|nr:serine/threonine protein kinase Ran1 [Chytriomyces hyalinus]
MSDTVQYTLRVTSTDAAWADSVEFALFSLLGIRDVSIDEPAATVKVTADPALLSSDELVSTITAIADDYTVEMLPASTGQDDSSHSGSKTLNGELPCSTSPLAAPSITPSPSHPAPLSLSLPVSHPPAAASLSSPPSGQHPSKVLSPSIASTKNNSLNVDAISPRLGLKSGIPISEKALLDVGGMTCAACVNTIESNVSKAPGILSIKVSLLAQRAEIEFNPSIIQRADIPNLIEDMGFDAALIQQAQESKGSITLQIYGMTCASCSGTITQQVSLMPGIKSVSINLLAKNGVFTFDKSNCGVRDIIEKIEDLGFDAHVADGGTNSQLESLNRTREIQEWRTAFWRAFVFAFPVSVVSMFVPKSITSIRVLPGVHVGVLAMFLLTCPVQFGVARRFYVSAYKAVSHGSYTMDVLITLGTTIAFAFSTFTMIRSLMLSSEEPPEVFFETCASLITFVTLGRYLENLAKGKTSTALSKLMSLAPSHAVLLTVDKSTGLVSGERKIATELIQPGDLIKIVPGERIAADGVVVFGSSHVDESLVTGESRTVSKKLDDPVIAGTINTTGMLHMRATRVGTDTTLSQILKLVSDAQTSKAPIQDLADQVASIFVPGVIALGCATFAFWTMVFMCTDFVPVGYTGDRFFLAVKMGISVIVVACPCALGLATPTAVMVGTGVGAGLGILIKGGGPLSVANSVTKVVFDKTGTLTMGKMGVTKHIFKAPKRNEDNRDSGSKEPLGPAQFLGIVGTVEEASEHAIGRAVLKYCKDSLKSSSFGFALHSFESVPGSGVYALVGTPVARYDVCIGNARFLESRGVKVSGVEITAVKKQEETGLTVVLVGVDGVFCGTFALSDVLKPESKATVAALRQLGLNVCMVTGDQELTALAIAEQCGITEVHAGVSPAGKKLLVEQMQADGEVVAMIGDGVNDSASIAQSDVGIAVFGGTDVAIEAASIVLMREDMIQIVTALDLCRTIYSRIRLNFVWATGYNLLMVPLAMGFGVPWGIMLPPMLAGMAMSLSSVSVVVSSLLLRTYRKPSSVVAVSGTDDELETGTVEGGAQRLLESLNFDDEVSKASNGAGGWFSVGSLLQRLKAFASGREYRQIGEDAV